MSERHDLFLRFTDQAIALATAQTLGFVAPGDTEWPPDGWLNGVYFCTSVCFSTGILTDSEGNAIPGYHVNLLWMGPLDQLPDLGEVLLNPSPSTPSVVFG